ncbi:MAG: bis(5'-nucleosyl)-tetraphosphatase (symmetrical) YqeK [Vampirovibrio sp.]|nr:bis(5'-nucleosyl)-tetraphosphatase (symmetrical) YqeK [Vampirovibrio sp.]
MIETAHKSLESAGILTFDFDKAKQWLQSRLSDRRFEHSLGAYKKAGELAEKFNLSPEDCTRALIAGLLHDSAKLLTPPELFAYCDANGLALSDEDRAAPQTIHPYVGAEMVRRHFGLEDETALNAMRYHTTARANMTTVEIVVYIADKIEENTRNPLYIQKMARHLDCTKPESLDETMLFLLDSTLSFLIEKQHVIHPQTMAARNDFVTRLKQRKDSNSSGKPETTVYKQ